MLLVGRPIELCGAHSIAKTYLDVSSAFPAFTFENQTRVQ